MRTTRTPICIRRQDLVAYNNNLKGVVLNPLNGGVYANYYTTYK